MQLERERGEGQEKGGFGERERLSECCRERGKLSLNRHGGLRSVLI